MIEVCGFRVPARIVRDAVHPAFVVRLQFLPEIVQDDQRGVNLIVAHARRFECRLVRSVHARSSPQIGNAMV